MIMKLEISQELAQEITNYLVTKPFNEVAPLIDKLQKTLKPIQDDVAKEPLKDIPEDKNKKA